MVVVSLTCLFFSGCRHNDGPIPPQPPPIPTPEPPQPPLPPDIDIDPNAPEKIVGFNVTFEKMQKDIVGKWVTLDSSHRWNFLQGDSVNLSKLGDSSLTVISRNEVIVDANVIATSPRSPGTQLSGVLKLRYEQVDGRWFLTEVIRISAKITTK
jgi:hypothetical protein